MYTHIYAYTSYKVTPLLQNDKKLAKAAPIFVQMLKSETRPETADAVLIIKKLKNIKKRPCSSKSSSQRRAQNVPMWFSIHNKLQIHICNCI